MQDFEIKLTEYVNLIQSLIDKHWIDSGFKFALSPLVETNEGSRYIRIVKSDRRLDGVIAGSKSVHTFVDKTNGDILKGSWKAPVKNGVRGNIFKTPELVINHYGANYLR